MFKKTILKFIAITAVSAFAFASAGPVQAANGPLVDSERLSNETLFSDVPLAHDHAENIYLANDLGILSGYPDGTFKPNQSLTRGNVVKALGKYILAVYDAGIEEFDLTRVKPFKDVPKTHKDQELYRFSLLVRDGDIFTGDQNNNLLPNKLITRQQMAKVLVETFGFEDLPGVESLIQDNAKASDDDYRMYINILSENGITVVKKFNPTATVTRGQFASFLVRSVEVSYETEVNEFIALVNGADTVEELEFVLDSYYVDFMDINRMNEYFTAMRDVEFKTLEEIQSVIDTVNAVLPTVK